MVDAVNLRFLRELQNCAIQFLRRRQIRPERLFDHEPPERSCRLSLLVSRVINQFHYQSLLLERGREELIEEALGFAQPLLGERNGLRVVHGIANHAWSRFSTSQSKLFHAWF